jgi:RNA recognition motif-containing protein
VGGLSYDATEQDVREFFADCGDITAIDLEMRNDRCASEGTEYGSWRECCCISASDGSTRDTTVYTSLVRVV